MILSKAANLIWGDVDLFIFHAESVGPAFDGEGAGVSGTRVPGDGAALGAGRVAHFEVEDVGGEETSGVESGAEEEEVEVGVAKDFVTLETYRGSVGGVDNGGMG